MKQDQLDPHSASHLLEVVLAIMEVGARGHLFYSVKRLRMVSEQFVCEVENVMKHEPVMEGD